MSYDLYLSSTQLDRQAVEAHFRSRPDYEVDGSATRYANERTGVYFSFEWDDGPIAFNLNFLRPHFFGLEAEPQVAALVKKFDLSIEDPQNEGMGEGPYSREGFLRGWNAGNRFAYVCMAREKGIDTFATMPTDELQRIWDWNRQVSELQQSLGDQIFVPRIMFLQHQGKVRSAVVWGDAIPIALPSVDVLLLPRKEFAPRSWFRKVEDIAIVTMEEARAVLPPADREGYRRLDYAEPPKSIVELFRKAPTLKDKPAILSPDQVLNRELFA